MAIEKVEMYQVSCDNCGEDFKEINSCVDVVQQKASDCDWLKSNDRHYCPDCWSYDSNDNLIIKHNNS